MISLQALSKLMPMHLVIDSSGRVLSCGATLAKVAGDIEHLEDRFYVTHCLPNESGIEHISTAANCGGRITLRLEPDRTVSLRGHVVPIGKGRMLINLGFGTGLTDAVRRYRLTDADFAPSELVMEVMFLHEANRAVTQELSRHGHLLEEAREAAEMQAYTDPLTGLHNRRGLEVAFQNIVGHRQRGTVCEFAIAHIDLDYFKALNDTFGHAAGDEALVRVAQYLRSEVRAQDSVARIGGDEFVLLLPGMVDEDSLLRLGERIIAKIEQPMEFNGRTASVSASIGAVVSTAYRQLELSQMLADSDEALYLSKRKGRGQARLFNNGAQDG